MLRCLILSSEDLCVFLNLSSGTRRLPLVWFDSGWPVDFYSFRFCVLFSSSASWRVIWFDSGWPLVGVFQLRHQIISQGGRCHGPGSVHARTPPLVSARGGLPISHCQRVDSEPTARCSLAACWETTYCNATLCTGHFVHALHRRRTWLACKFHSITRHVRTVGGLPGGTFWGFLRLGGGWTRRPSCGLYVLILDSRRIIERLFSVRILMLS
jgi:hypothetical protein